MKPTLLSLFSGIGGIDLAFERAGFQIKGQVEIDDYCNKVLSKHWPTVRRWRDVRTFSRSDLACSVDVIAGGFPCQDISQAGRRSGIKEGNRSGLWFEFRRIIGEFRPAYVLLENVADITVRGGLEVIADLANLGYDAEWGIISASNAGAPHVRDRWFCVAYPTSERCHDHIRHCDGNPQDADRQATDGQTDREKAQLGASLPTRSQESARITAQPIMDRAAHGLSRRLDEGRWPAKRNCVPFPWEAPHVKMPDADRQARIKALGNAVVPQCVQPIAEAIYQALVESRSLGGE